MDRGPNPTTSFHGTRPPEPGGQTLGVSVNVMPPRRCVAPGRRLAIGFAFGMVADRAAKVRHDLVDGDDDGESPPSR